jgi:hypothetical protein
MLNSIVGLETSKQFPASGTKSNATVTSLAQKNSQPSKLPPNAKIVGNYLLGENEKTQERTSGRAPSEKCIWRCTSPPTRRWP